MTVQSPHSLYVYSAVPPNSNRLLRKYGLLSGVETVKNAEVLKAARPDAKLRRDFVKRTKATAASDRPYSVMGPSVLFTLPDPDKITDKHFIKQWGLQTIRIDLGRLVKDYPDTIIWGAELLPYNYAWRDMSDEEFDEEIADLGFSSWEDFLNARSRPLTLDEVHDFTITDPVVLWEHYHKSAIGKKYASNVPHAFIITPMGYIPYKYIEYVDYSRGNPSEEYTIFYESEREHSYDDFVDMYEIDPDSIDPWRLARKVGIGITRGKEFYAGHLYKGGLVSALFIDAQDCFSFDVVVDPAHQAKGLGAELVDVAISEFDTAENYFDWDDEYAPESYEYCVEVVNPHMKRLLERKGFYVHETSTDGNSWLMRRARQNPQNLPIYVNNLGIHTNAPIPLYHGSPRLIEQFKPTPHYLAEGEAVVFGTPFIEIAVSCMRFWTDDDFEQGIVGDDPPYMIEQYPGAFEEIYGGKQGYLYELASDTFVRSEALARFELFSYEPPKIISSYVCDDVLKLLKSTDMQMVDFEDRDAYIQKGYRR